MEIKNQAVCIDNIRIPLVEFPELYSCFIEKTGCKSKGTWTPDVEQEGARLLAHGFADKTETIAFVKQVFEWGGPSGNRVRGQVFKNQTEREVWSCVRETSVHLRDSDITAAISKITSLGGLHISYGSKILRMISPDKCGVYDSVLEDKMKYHFTSEGYTQFCGDLVDIVEALKSRGIENPKRANGVWLVADVEAAIFHQVGQ